MSTEHTYTIVREPGPAARRNAGRWAPRPKAIATVTGFGQRDALAEFVHDRYLSTGNRQVEGYRFEWRGSRAEGAAWKIDDLQVKRGRDWRAVVTLANGVNVHDAVFYAWQEKR